jgi:ribosomal protein S18 acetylase RimI-like enzyme
MPPCIIRRATYNEAKRLKEFDEFIGDRRIDNWRGELFVAIAGDLPVGFVSFNSNEFYHRPFIAVVCVHQDHRRRGIAMRLMQRVLELHEGIDVWTSTESNNAVAQDLFAKLGFKSAGSLSFLNRDESLESFYVRPGTL